MNRKSLPLGVVAAFALALASSATAAVKLNDTVSVSGYAAGSYQFNKQDGGSSNDRLDIDAAGIDFDYKLNKVSAKIGGYYTPNDQLDLLDVNVTYDFGNGHSLTGGKYLSSLGYESFHIPARTFVTPHATTGLIPGYRSGLKYAYTSAKWNGGVAVSDAEVTGLKGDGELRDNYGTEAFVSYTGIKGLTLFAGVGYQSATELAVGAEQTSYVADFWASYSVNAKLALAAEYAYSKSDLSYYGADTSLEVHSWLTEAKYTVSNCVTVAGRLHGMEFSGATDRAVGVSVAPAYKVTANLEIRGELGYTDYDMSAQDNARVVNVGVQAVFTF